LRKRRMTILPTARSKLLIPGLLGAKTLSMSAQSKALAGFTSKPSSTRIQIWAAAKLYTTKTPITVADMLNDKVLPFFEEQGMGVLRMLTDRSTEYCGSMEKHDYEFFFSVCGIENTKTKVRNPQTNCICERFHKTILNEFYQVAFRCSLCTSLDSLQADLDAWMDEYNTERTHQGKMCCGRTPMATMLEGKSLWTEHVSKLN